MVKLLHFLCDLKQRLSVAYVYIAGKWLNLSIHNRASAVLRRAGHWARELIRKFGLRKKQFYEEEVQ